MEANSSSDNNNSHLSNRLRRRRYLRRRRARGQQRPTATVDGADGDAAITISNIGQTNASGSLANNSSSTDQTTTPPILNISTPDDRNIITTDTLNQTSAPDDESKPIAQDPDPDPPVDLETFDTTTSETVAPIQTPRSLPTTPIMLSTIRPAVTLAVNPSVNAVRVLFSDQQQVSRQATGNSITTTGNSIARTTAPIVSANRRLIERQIEAIQEADSRRWNFDFINCRPLGQSGHRYVDFSESPRNCRPLNAQNRATTTTLFNSQQQWRSPTRQGGELQRHSDHKQDDG